MENSKLLSVVEYVLAKDEKGNFTEKGAKVTKRRGQMMARVYIIGANLQKLQTGKM